MSIPIGGIDGRGALSSQLAPTNTESVAPGKFEAVLAGMLAPDSEGQVNEEQLFAALINERLTSTKGAEVAQEFETRYQASQAEFQRGDGYIFLEDSAKAALKSMSDDGLLSLEEAESVHAQAFQGAQLDDNKDALYDSFGSTMAVTMVELAIQSAQSELTKFDEGTASAGRRAFDTATDMSGESGESAGTGAVVTGAYSDESGAEPLSGSYSDGLIWKPSSDSNGDVAIILNSSLRGKIGMVSLYDNNGNKLEDTSVERVDEKGRSILFFDRAGHDYPDNMTVRVALNDGDAIQYRVPNPSSRMGY